MKDFLKRNHNLSILFIVFAVVTAYYYYEYVGLNLSLVRIIRLLVLGLLGVLSYDVVFKRFSGQRYSNILRGILFVYVFSIVLAYVFWHQSLFLGFRSTTPDLFILLYFFLITNEIDIKVVERSLAILSFIYLIVWAISVYTAPRVVFGIEGDRMAGSARGFYRFFIEGSRIVPLAFFFFLNKFYNSKKTFWIIVAVILYVIVILHVRRQEIFWTTAVGLYYIFRQLKYRWVYLFLTIGAFSFFINISIDDDSIIGIMLNQTNAQFERQSGGEEDIRISASRFYLLEYHKNPVTFLLGNGIPNADSSFGTYRESIQSRGFFTQDIGFIGLFADFGLVGVILYLVLLYKVITQKVSSQYMYAKLFILWTFGAFLLSHTLTTTVMLNCFCLYILELDNADQTLDDNNVGTQSYIQFKKKIAHL